MTLSLSLEFFLQFTVFSKFLPFQKSPGYLCSSSNPCPFRVPFTAKVSEQTVVLAGFPCQFLDACEEEAIFSS